ncbi:hypothetical protein CBM2637_B110329 [Cupriavidus taiwanensis]|nr:hypothetical protein CBM2637_B110329 [Cupriavidus taiwanensis]
MRNLWLLVDVELTAAGSMLHPESGPAEGLQEQCNKTYAIPFFGISNNLAPDQLNRCLFANVT